MAMTCGTPNLRKICSDRSVRNGLIHRDGFLFVLYFPLVSLANIILQDLH